MRHPHRTARAELASHLGRALVAWVILTPLLMGVYLTMTWRHPILLP